MKRFIDCVIPFRTCNLRCHYCYITHTKCWGDKLPEFRFDADHIGKALSIDRLGGVSLINICGEGETLLPPEIIQIIHNILKNGHYVMVVTNGTLTRRFDEIAKLPVDCLDRLLIKFSFHYLQLKEKNRISIFFDNVKKVKQAGCSISVELTPSDEMIPYIDNAISLCQTQLGAACHVTVARNERNPSLSILTEYSKPAYENIWNKFESKLFEFKMKMFGVKRTEYCYAGLWSGILNLVSGDLRQCYRGGYIQNIYADLKRPINFTPIGRHCPEPHCYNAHAFMTLGLIPSIRTPTLSEMRNHLYNDGSEWLTPNMKQFLSKRLGDANTELSWVGKCRHEIYRRWKTAKIDRITHSLLSRVRKLG